MDKKRIKAIINNIPKEKKELLGALEEFKGTMSYRLLGEKIGISYAVLPRILSGQKNVSIETLSEYIRILLESGE